MIKLMRLKMKNIGEVLEGDHCNRIVEKVRVGGNTQHHSSNRISSNSYRKYKMKNSYDCMFLLKNIYIRDSYI